ncbi:unnamed protein product [Sphenostylis stenocarpa]|uniref:Glabrous enhancer-binding protein-like DBD domain-containing protein n=1 Tax=Sphenostylis stenocarpa TaxID=92480 RepID=A0AA86TCJ1_9FABA|nr:unnamed protein product [Sphenostylis stenocarpa]
MAQKQKPKRPSPLDEPPTASSSDSEEEEMQQPSSMQHEEEEEEEVSSGEEEEESSGEEAEDDDLPPPISKTHAPPPPKTPHPQPSSSDSKTESEFGTESESESTPAKVVKPLASKPMDQAQKPKVLPATAPSKPSLKRPAENNNAAHVAKKKKKSGDSSSSTAASDEEMEVDGKKSGDQLKKSGDQLKKQRLWSEEDELAILKGMIEFASKTGQDPLKFAGTNAFHDFMKKSVHVEVTGNQLKEKVRRLKKKYEIAAVRGNSAEGLTFTKPHDQKTFELSKKVWGSEQDGGVANGAVEKPKANGSAAKTPKKKETGSRNVASAKKVKPEPKQELAPVLSLEWKGSEKMQIDPKPDSGEVTMFLHAVSRFTQGFGICGLDERDVRRGLELIGESKSAELREKWKKLQRAELELFVKRAELIAEQTKLIAEALWSSNH